MLTSKASFVSMIAGTALGILAIIPFIGVVTGVTTVLYAVPAALLGLLLALGMASHRVALSVTMAQFVACVFLFVGWMLLSALWSTSPGVDTRDELYRLLTLLLFVVLGAFVLSRQATESAGTSLIVASLLVAGFVFRGYLQTGSTRGFAELSEFYLVIATIVGVGYVVAVLRALAGRQRMVAGPAAVILAAALAMSLARGALISSMLITVLGGAYCAWKHRAPYRSFSNWIAGQGRRLGLLGGIVTIIGLAMFSALQVERTRLRLLRMVSGEEFTEGPRAQLWRQAAASIADAPILGYGLGSSGRMAGATADSYVHNWLLQVWLDAGIIGVLLCLAAIAFPVVVGLRSRRSELATGQWLPLLGAYVFMLLEYAKSSDFYTARVLFILGVLLVSLGSSPAVRRTCQKEAIAGGRT